MVESIKALRRNLSLALAQRRLEEAEAIVFRLQQEDPLSVQTRGGELELLLLSEHLDEAARLAGRLVKQFPTSPRIHYLAGRVFYRRREYEEAQAHFEESAAIAGHWKTRHWLGKTLTQLGRYDPAESILLSLLEEHPSVRVDIAWIYERRGEIQRAISGLERYLRTFPDDEFAQNSLKRLRARRLNRSQLIEEVQTLQEFNEEIPDAVRTEYLQGLIESGEIEKFRRLLPDLLAGLPEKDLTSLAWSCHRAKAQDLAFAIFLQTFERNYRSPKFLAALESDARRAGRIPELLEVYRQYAPKHPQLYGRAKSLERRSL